MIPEPEPDPAEPLTLIFTTDGSTLWATFTTESLVAAGTAELPLWVMVGDEATELSWLGGQAGGAGAVGGGGPGARPADPCRAADEQAGRHDRGGQPLAAQPPARL